MYKRQVDKLAAVFRLAPGTEFIDKLTGGFANFGAAFANPLPCFHPVDLLIGVAGGALLKLAVYIKGKNRKSSESFKSVRRSLKRQQQKKLSGKTVKELQSNRECVILSLML